MRLALRTHALSPIAAAVLTTGGLVNLSKELANAVSCIWQRLYPLPTGKKDRHNIWGIDIVFDLNENNYSPYRHVYDAPSPYLKDRVWTFCSQLGNLIALSPLSTFVHEMGHAVATRTLTGTRPTAVIKTDGTTYNTWGYMPWDKETSSTGFSTAQISAIMAAGPVTQAIFSSAWFLAPAAFLPYAPLPVVAVLSTGGFMNMTRELRYAIDSFYNAWVGRLEW